MPRPSPAAAWRAARGAAAVAAARLRFLLPVGILLGTLAVWPALRYAVERLTTSAPTGGTVSGDTEFWCPMCPGVRSDWPNKCPVCNMALVRRQKGEMTPLPDGVVARVQLSPYRLQLAGVRTAPVEYRRLDHEVTVAGFLEPGTGSGLMLAADVFESDARALVVGQEVRVTSDAAPGEAVAGRVAEMTPAVASGRRVRVRVEDPRGELRPGAFAAAVFRTPVSRLAPAQRVAAERWRDATAGSLLTGRPDGALTSLLDAGARQAVARDGFTLCVPEPAVIDTGVRRVVYTEAMPGVFDAVEVRLGRRYGDFYPVLSGLEPGQRVATAGAVLLDAETRLNPSLAASYFGAGPTPPKAAAPPPSGPAMSEDQLLAARQKVCPVTEEPLDSMGGPVRLVVDGRVVFICCRGCENRLRAKSAEYLKKLPN